VKKNILITFTALFCLFTTSFSQENDSVSAYFKPVIHLEYLYGRVDNPVKIEDHANSQYGKISILNETGRQENSYFKHYKNPFVGISFLVGYLGNKDVFGSTIGIYPQWTYHFIQKKSLSWDINLGSGFAFFTRPFDKVTNPDNKLIGSHFSNITDISTSVVFRFHPKILVRTGVGLIHVSNGHTAIPNIGLNDLTVRLGMIYKPGELVGLKMPKPQRYEQDSIWRKSIGVSVGRHELAYTTYPVDGPTYHIYSVMGYISKQVSPINEIKFGINYSYYRGYHTLIVHDEMYDYFKFFRSSVISLQIGHEFLMNHFGFVTDIGLKVVDPIYRNFFLKYDETPSGWFKQYVTGRLGFEIYPYKNAFSGKKLSLGMYIKTNLFQADFVEYNMTYTF
jgi:hypothetical protein